MTAEIGDCVVSNHCGQLLILQADPRTLIHPEVLAEMRAGRLPWARVLQGPDGELVWIQGANRSVLYRILGQVPPFPGAATDPRTWPYLAQWPD